MATFHGFKITKMQTWEGMEGIGTAGNLYWGSRKLGQFIDYGNGGMMDFRFPYEELDKAIRNECPNLTQEAFGYAPIGDMGGLETLVLHLANLVEREKSLRKAWKQAAAQGRVLVSAYVGNERHDFTLVGSNQNDYELRVSVEDYLSARNMTADRIEVWRSLPTIDEFPQPVTSTAAKAEAKRAAEFERDVQRRIREMNGLA